MYKRQLIGPVNELAALLADIREGKDTKALRPMHALPVYDSDDDPFDDAEDAFVDLVEEGPEIPSSCNNQAGWVEQEARSALLGTIDQEKFWVNKGSMKVHRGRVGRNDILGCGRHCGVNFEAFEMPADFLAEPIGAATRSRLCQFCF